MAPSVGVHETGIPAVADPDAVKGAGEVHRLRCPAFICQDCIDVLASDAAAKRLGIVGDASRGDTPGLSVTRTSPALQCNTSFFCNRNCTHKDECWHYGCPFKPEGE